MVLTHLQQLLWDNQGFPLPVLGLVVFPRLAHTVLETFSTVPMFAVCYKGTVFHCLGSSLLHPVF